MTIQTRAPVMLAQTGHRLANPGQKPTTMGAGTVSAAYLNTLLEVATRAGVDRDGLLAAAGIDATALAHNAGRIAVVRMLDLFDAAMRVTADSMIGLHMGMQAQPRSFNALGYAAMSCRTLGEAVELIPRYEGVVYDGGTTTLRREGTRVHLCWAAALPDPAAPSVRPLNEAIVAGWLAYGRWITGREAPIEQVRFRHAAPERLGAYTEFFGIRPDFDCDDNALVFDAALLEVPLVQHDDELRQLMEARAQSQIDQLQAMSPLLRQVVSEIRQRLPRGECSIAAVAASVGMSERSLRRHLQAEGGNFQSVLNQVRYEQAKAYLRDPGLSVVEVALLLGYAEQSAFSAAFRGWSGCSPREYQRTQRTPALDA
ncbi:AraC family transcriptional regulator [Sinimarinibacterium sp. CAU 1509]|uniref:AraC family transcriptional regulator n=1 Tax=Sinimarinibacterium sp. CAU 1509 TaxID=2562283 RepID=UPI00146B4FFC|nr:AraC family transcriptional regulator [Sinimarinibacterium sp. CAU 1509]